MIKAFHKQAANPQGVITRGKKTPQRVFPMPPPGPVGSQPGSNHGVRSLRLKAAKTAVG